MEKFQIALYLAKGTKSSVEDIRIGTCEYCKESKTVGTFLYNWKRDRYEDWDFDQVVICKDCLVSKGIEVVTVGD